METDIILINDTEETGNREGDQQCNKVEVIEIPDDDPDESRKENCNPDSTITSSEPIDLTVTKLNFPDRPKQLPYQNGYPPRKNPQLIIKHKSNCNWNYPRTSAHQNSFKSPPEIWSRGLKHSNTVEAHKHSKEPHRSYRNNIFNKKPNLPHPHMGTACTIISRTNSMKNHQNVLKTAKSLFSKRTRTLYHWMYPNCTAQQIKEAVSKTWESMSVQEKNIYVSQVLGHPETSSTNLMVNPQLGQIQALQPQIRCCSVNQFNPKSTELQNAISSISNEINDFTSSMSAEPEIMMNSITNKPSHYFTSTNQEFDDDPELNKELIQFSLTFKN